MEKPPFSIGMMNKYQFLQKLNTRTNLLLLFIYLMMIVTISPTLINIYSSTHKTILVSNITTYLSPEKQEEKRDFIKIICKNFAIDLLEFGQYNVANKISNIYNSSRSKSNARDKIQQLLNQDYAQKTKKEGRVQFFKIMEDIKGEQLLQMEENEGQFKVSIQGIQRIIDKENSIEKRIEIHLQGMLAENEDSSIYITDFNLNEL